MKRRQHYEPISPQSPFVQDVARLVEALVDQAVGHPMGPCQSFDVLSEPVRKPNVEGQGEPGFFIVSTLAVRYYISPESLRFLLGNHDRNPRYYTHQDNEVARFTGGECPMTTILIPMSEAVKADWLGIVEKHYPK